MAKPLTMLLKAYWCERWANEFLDGCLYCNTLSFHRKKDSQEGAVVIPGSNITQFKIGPHEFKVGPHGLKTVKRVTYRLDIADYINVFCMYSWAPPFEDSAKKRVILNKETQLGSLRTHEDTYGPYTVLVRDIPEFLRRLSKSVERPESQILSGEGNLVTYKLMDRIPKRDDMEDVIQLAFHKDSKFAGEKEYRFAFLLDRDKPGFFRLKIGSIRDIAVLLRTRELYDLIEVNGSKDF